LSGIFPKRADRHAYIQSRRVLEPMSGAAPSHSRKIIAAVLALVIIGAILGSYLAIHLSQPEKAAGHGLTVLSNDVVLVGVTGFNYSGGIWRLQIGNAGDATQHAAYQLFVNGNLADGNSSTLQPGQESNATACLIPATKSTAYRVSIFVSNSSGTFSNDYPVARKNATQIRYSGQFTATNDLRASGSSVQRNFSEWSIVVNNTYTKPIRFAYAELWSNATLLSAAVLLCAGGSTPLSYYDQPLAPGQAANVTRTLYSTGPAVAAGEAYKVDVIAVYSDYSEVIQSYAVQATM